MSQRALDPPRGVLGLLRRRPFYVHIGAIFVLLILAILLAIGWVTRLETRKMVQQSAEQLFAHVGHEVAQQLRLLRGPIELAVQFGAALQAMSSATSLDARLAQIDFLTRALESEPQMSAIYFAYDNGDFFLVRPLRDAAARALFKAPADAAYLVQSVERGGQQRRWLALSRERKTLAVWAPPDAGFDARTRPWYREAMAKG